MPLCRKLWIFNGMYFTLFYCEIEYGDKVFIRWIKKVSYIILIVLRFFAISPRILRSYITEKIKAFRKIYI
jgi:hypothetical protein